MTSQVDLSSKITQHNTAMAKKDSRKDAKKDTPKTAVTADTTSGKNKTTTSFIDEITNSVKSAHKQYLNDLESSQKLRLIDTFLAFLVVVGIFQFGFCLIGGSFPFNAFLAGFSATVGQFVLTVALRLQSVTENSKLFNGLLPERAFGEYIFASLILHFVLIHFIN